MAINRSILIFAFLIACGGSSYAVGVNCEKKDISKFRDQAKKLFNAKQTNKAVELLKTTWDRCGSEFDDSGAVVWLASDLTYYIYHEKPRTTECKSLFDRYGDINQPLRNPTSKAAQALFANYEKCMGDSVVTSKPISLLDTTGRSSALPVCQNKKLLFKLSMKKKDLKYQKGYGSMGFPKFSFKAIQNWKTASREEMFTSENEDAATAAGIEWVGDLNKDDLQDVIIKSMCSNHQSCVYEIFLNCGKSLFAHLNEGYDDDKALGNTLGIDVVRDTTLVNGTPWLNITQDNTHPIEPEEVEPPRTIYRFNGEQYRETSADKKSRIDTDLKNRKTKEGKSESNK